MKHNGRSSKNGGGLKSGRGLLREGKVERRGPRVLKVSKHHKQTRKSNKYVVAIRETKRALSLVVTREWAQLAVPERTSWLAMALER